MFLDAEHIADNKLECTFLDHNQQKVTRLVTMDSVCAELNPDQLNEMQPSISNQLKECLVPSYPDDKNQNIQLLLPDLYAEEITSTFLNKIENSDLCKISTAKKRIILFYNSKGILQYYQGGLLKNFYQHPLAEGAPVLMLYTKNSIGGDFNQFSRKVRQMIIYSRAPISFSELQQYIHRVRKASRQQKGYKYNYPIAVINSCKTEAEFFQQTKVLDNSKELRTEMLLLKKTIMDSLFGKIQAKLDALERYKIANKEYKELCRELFSISNSSDKAEVESLLKEIDKLESFKDKVNRFEIKCKTNNYYDVIYHFQQDILEELDVSNNTFSTKSVLPELYLKITSEIESIKGSDEEKKEKEQLLNILKGIYERLDQQSPSTTEPLSVFIKEILSNAEVQRLNQKLQFVFLEHLTLI